jgi:hypothetical protein
LRALIFICALLESGTARRLLARRGSGEPCDGAWGGVERAAPALHPVPADFTAEDGDETPLAVALTGLVRD